MSLFPQQVSYSKRLRQWLKGIFMANGMESKKKVNAQPEAGARQPAGKSSECDAVLRKGNMPPTSQVSTVKEDENKGVATKLASANEDGNPKKRTCNSWGIKTPSCKK